MAITIEDVAREAGVCIGTVSRVINGKDRVHPKTREKIQGVIKRLDYRPSLLGRGLVTRRTHNIMLLVHNLADPFCVAIAKHLSGLCRNQGYKLLMGDSDHSPEIEAECLEMVRDGSVDGLIVAPVGGCHNQSLFRNLATSGFPVVSVNDSLSDCHIPCVKFDDHLAGRIAADHLLDQGHRRIAFVDRHTEFQTMAERHRGFQESHAARGIPISNDLHLRLPPLLNDARNVLATALVRGSEPTAMVAGNEMVAITCFNALDQLNRSVPEEVALLSFGNMFPDGSMIKPMTTVSMPVDQLAERAWRLLQKRIQKAGKPPAMTAVDLVSPTLSVRQTA